MKTFLKLVAVVAIVLAPLTGAGPAKANPFKECEPGETSCQCGLYVDTSRGLKNTTIGTHHC